jgi:hypothetical protein
MARFYPFPSQLLSLELRFYQIPKSIHIFLTNKYQPFTPEFPKTLGSPCYRELANQISIRDQRLGALPAFFHFQGAQTHARHCQPNRREPSQCPKSTGPTTAEGKKRSSLNALKTGLTGRTVLMPGEDAEAYRLHCERFEEDFQPATTEEEELVQSLADLKWRLIRCSQLEHNLFALGRVEFAQTFDHEPEPVRSCLIQAHTLRAYAKDLNNLSIQETRLDKRFQRELVQLQQLQAKRQEEERIALRQAAQLCLQAKQENKPFIPAEFGFEFSTEELELYIQVSGLARAAQMPARTLAA